MSYAFIENGKVQAFPYTVKEFRDTHPHISLPEEPTQDQLEEVGIYPITIETRPSITHAQNVELAEPVKTESGWVASWDVYAASAEEIRARTETRAKEIRDARNDELKASDWTQLKDAPVNPQIWQEYREALRNLTAQPEFPWSINWPVNPMEIPETDFQ